MRILGRPGNRPPAQRGSGYRDSFAVDLDGAPDRTAGRWMRAVFDDAPPVVRAVLHVGFRFLLGVDLGPDRTLTYLTARLLTEPRAGHAEIVLLSRSLHSRLSTDVHAGTLRFSTRVRFRTRGAAATWTLVRPIHVLIVPYLLGRAVRAAATDRRVAVDPRRCCSDPHVF